MANQKYRSTDNNSSKDQPASSAEKLQDYKRLKGHIPSEQEGLKRVSNRRNNLVRKNLRSSYSPSHNRSLAKYSRAKNLNASSKQIVSAAKTLPSEQLVGEIGADPLGTAALDPEFDYTVLIKPCWRAAWPELLMFLFSTFLVIAISTQFALLQLQYTLPIVNTDFNFPYLLIIPIFFIGKAIFKHGNVYATMGNKKLNYHTGCLTIKHKIVEMESDSMQVVQVSQSIVGKLLNYGNISVGRFSRRNLEFEIHGVSNPQAVIKKIKRKIKLARSLKADGPNKIFQDEEFIEEIDEDSEKK